MESLELYNGIKLPRFCLGTNGIPEEVGKVTFKYQCESILDKRKRKNLKERHKLERVIETYIENGGMMIDTSRSYHACEMIIGDTLKRYDRNQYIIVDKLSNVGQYNGDIRRAFEASLKRLGMDFIDVYLFHWPVDDIYLKTWKEMEKIYEAKLCKAIGVCNCKQHHLERIAAVSNIKPMINQFECHPLFTRMDLREYCQKEHIQVMAYTSTARMDSRMKKTEIQKIADEHKRNISQIILRWHQQIGNIPIVSTMNPAHIVENLDIDDIELTKGEIEKIEKVNINSILRFDSDNCDFTQL